MMNIIKGHLIKYFLATFLIIFIRFSLALAAGSGYIITITVHGWVHDQSNSNKGVEGIQIAVRVDYAYHPYMIEGEPQGYDRIFDSKTVITNSEGYFSATFEVEKWVYDIFDISAEMQETSNWLLISTMNNPLIDTSAEYRFYIIPMVDDDGNGIHDPYEFILAQKFAPELQPNRGGTYLLPEPAQIMGGNFNSQIYVTLTSQKHKLKGPWRLDLLDYYDEQSHNWKPICPEYIGNVEKRFDYSDLFQQNPKIFNYLITRVWKEDGSNRGKELKEDSTIVIAFQNFQTQEFLPLFLWYHFDWPGATEGEWNSSYNQERIQNRFQNTIYAVIWRDSNNRKPIIQYWFFYPYDDFVNDHEGDWEHINIILNNQVPSEAKISDVQYYFHSKWMEVKESDLETADLEKNHPMVYIGGSGDRFGRKGENSGGSYPKRGIYTRIGPQVTNETVYGLTNVKVPYMSFTMADDNPNDSRGLELLKDPLYLRSKGFFSDRDANGHPELSWLNSFIRFGEPKSEYIAPTLGQHEDINSKTGPSKNVGWKIIGSSSGFAEWEGNYFPLNLNYH